MKRRCESIFVVLLLSIFQIGVTNAWGRKSKLSTRTKLGVANITSACLSKSVADRLVVGARFDEDTNWMAEQLDVPFFAYQAKSSSNVATSKKNVRQHSNMAREASAYLQFIAEYYDCLPEVTAFVHGHQFSWHSPNMVNLLHELRWDKVKGYLPLERKYFKRYGTFIENVPGHPEEHLQSVVAEGHEVYNGSFSDVQMVNGTVYADIEHFHFHQANEIIDAWQELFEPAGLGPLPYKIRYYCCAQFAVTRQRIQKRPRQFYLQAIHWIESEQKKKYRFIRRPFAKGLVFESLWHFIFGEPALLPNPTKGECEFFDCIGKNHSEAGSWIEKGWKQS